MWKESYNLWKFQFLWKKFHLVYNANVSENTQLNSNAELHISMSTSIKKVQNGFMDSQVLIQFDVFSF
jgi:hypothetical protein